jgi:hypothetical protein
MSLYWCGFVVLCMHNEPAYSSSFLHLPYPSLCGMDCLGTSSNAHKTADCYTWPSFAIQNMKFATLALAATALALPQPQSATIMINPALVPPFGIEAGIPSGTQQGSCQGANNVNIPCECPPAWDEFIERLEQFVSAGNAFGIPVTFPTDASIESQLSRIDACIDTLQSVDDAALGEGCPIAAAPNFSAIQASLLQQL